MLSKINDGDFVGGMLMFHQSIADETAFTRTLWIQQRVMTLGDSMRLSWAVIKKERTDAASDKFNASDDLSH